MQIKASGAGFLVILCLLTLAISVRSDEVEKPNFLLWEKPFSPVSGAENLYTLHSVLYKLEDAVFASKGMNSTESSQAIGIPVRLIRFLLLDLPIDYMPMLIQHEVFGHGYRFIESGYDKVSYSLHLPPPYGDGHGFTEAMFPARQTSLDQSIALEEAGMEANDVFAQTIRKKWMVSGEINHHDATLYLVNAFNRSLYVARTRFGSANSVSSNDIFQYLRLVNFRQGGKTLNNRPLDVEDLQFRMAVDALDPFTFFALWSVLGNYFIHGRPSYAFPVPEIAGTHILPLVHASLSPFGLEYYVESLMFRKSRSLRVTYRQGDPGEMLFYGLGFDMGSILDLRFFTADLRIEAWRQPRLRIGVNDSGQLGGTPEPMDFGQGVWVNLKAKSKIGYIATIGYKTRGFVAGENLDAGILLRGGICFQIPLHLE